MTVTRGMRGIPTIPWKGKYPIDDRTGNRMKNSKKLLKRLALIATVAVIVCSFMVSCGGQTAQKTFSGNVALHDGEGITQENLNNIATFMLNNAKAYEGVVAAYRGYNVLDPGFEVETGKVYEAKTKLVPKEALDENGKAKFDENGKPVYVVQNDENGNPMTDAAGAPVYVMVEAPDVNLDAALAVLAKENASLNTAGLDEHDVINLVEALRYAVTFEAQRGLIDNIMYGIGVALGWLTRTLGFGNYIIGICIFAIIIEIIIFLNLIPQKT